MRATCHDRIFLTRCTYATMASFLVWSMAAITPPVVRAAESPLGVANGAKEAQMAVDGKQWAPLSSSSNPVYEGTMLRTGKGTASVLLKDGTQLELQPGTVIGLSGSRTAPIIKIAVGQVLFRIPISSRAAFETPTVRYQTVNGNMGDRSAILKAKAPTLSVADPVGKFVVNRQGGSRIGLERGEIVAKSVSDPGLHIVKAGQSVYIPQVGALDPGFGVMLTQALPDEAVGGGATAAADVEAAIEGAAVVGETGAAGMAASTAVGLAVMGAAVAGGIVAGTKPSPSSP